MRVMRILDNDFKRLLLGSMSCVRRRQRGEGSGSVMLFWASVSPPLAGSSSKLPSGCEERGGDGRSSGGQVR